MVCWALFVLVVVGDLFCFWCLTECVCVWCVVGFCVLVLLIVLLVVIDLLYLY